MTNMTLAIPHELRERMEAFKEIRWSEVARRAIEKRVEDLEVMDRITVKSKLTKEDIKEISKRINSATAKKLGLK